MLEFSSEPIWASVKPQALTSCLFVRSLASHVSTWVEPVTRSSQSGMSDFIYAAVEPSLACQRLWISSRWALTSSIVAAFSSSPPYCSAGTASISEVSSDMRLARIDASNWVFSSS